ncbi:MAG TPA: FAD-dependent oxidoreductase [Holophagaceae bacterium]|nr:FAD-dependent oxidoreductase [Holophagaceae bacterium]
MSSQRKPEAGSQEPGAGSADLLVLGGGIAGCAAAITAADKGLSVLLVAKDGLGLSNTG